MISGVCLTTLMADNLVEELQQMGLYADEVWVYTDEKPACFEVECDGTDQEESSGLSM